jgi:DNA-binding response OmpR family regulator
MPASPENPTRLLVVDDDTLLAKGLKRNLEMEGFAVETVSDGESAVARIAEASPPFDLVVLDIMLPGIDGLEVFRRLQTARPDLPVLFLTAKGSDADRLIGLRLGADDYLTKPFLVEELVLRARGILRRSAWSQSPASTGPTIRIGLSTVDLDQLTGSTPTGAVHLTDRETMLLRFFAENDGRVLTRGELLERVWGYSFDTATRTLDTFIHRLRKHFEPDPQSPRHFHTVRGVGYRFTSDPEVNAE